MPAPASDRLDLIEKLVMENAKAISANAKAIASLRETVRELTMDVQTIANVVFQHHKHLEDLRKASSNNLSGTR